VEPRLSIVTLGVADMKRSKAFYEALGFTASPASNDNITFFNAGGVVLGLYGRQALADDANVAAGDDIGFSGTTIAHNCRSEAEVDAVLSHAETMGAKITKQAQKVFWGGYSGYFADLDGHLWEVAYNPFFPLNQDGQIMLPD
jgi:uncharacterized protein